MRHNLLHRVIADGHVATKLCLNDLLSIIPHDDEVSALVARPTGELGYITSAFVEPFYERLELVSVEVIEASRSPAVYRLEREVPFALVDEPAENTIKVLGAENDAMLLKIVLQIREVLSRERILLVLEGSLFRLRAPMIKKVIQHRAVVFRDRSILLIPFAGSMPAPQDRPDNNQNNKNDEPSDSLVEQGAIGKIQPKRA